MATNLKAVRGTRDLLPPETDLWQKAEATARSVFARYGFGEVRTPIMEDTQLFARGVGEETDIVSKEMYTWSDRDRFEKFALSKVWLADARSRYAEWTKNTQLIDEKSKADMVFRRPDGGVTLVSFVDKASNMAWRSLVSAIQAYRDTSGTTDVLGLLVYPEEIGSEGIPADIRNDHTVTIDGWPVRGNFFSTSQSLTLRPENTAGVVRAYIEHKLGETGQLQKLFYIGPQFRRERPQKGRYRQFYQIGAEVIGAPSSGSESPLRDAEVLEMLATLLNELGITDWTLQLNSVGSSSDRPRYVEALKAALQPVKAQLCADCQRRAETNPLRVLDCKVPEDQPIIATLPQIADYLDAESKAHFAAVLAALDACGVEYTLNPRLVRGLDYYTRTTFEFLMETGLGTQNALLGGGRYDGLSEMLGGPKAPGIGFAMGEDRLVLTLQALNAEAAAQKLDAYIAPMGEAQNPYALALAKELRTAGLRVDVGDGSFRLKKSFETADKVARRIVIVGEDEASTGVLTVKTFTSGEQTKVARAELISTLKTL